MDNKQYCEIMSSFGGKFSYDKDGQYWLFSSGEVVAEFEVCFQERGEGVRIVIDVSISHPVLSSVANVIMDDKPDTPQMFEWHESTEDIPNRTNVASGLQRFIKRELENLKHYKLQGLVDTFTKQCPDNRLMLQIMHLTALAYKGDFFQLSEYLEAIRRGKRYNFVPFISQAMLERAVDIAMENFAKKQK